VSAFDAGYEVATRRLVHSGACNKLQNFKYLIDTLRTDTVGLSLSEIYLKILEATGYEARLKEERTPEAQTRIENLQEFQNAILQFEEERDEEATLQAFLEEMALISDADAMNENSEAVTLMTLHLSKGLEFKNVFMVGLEEGLFPSGRALDDANFDQLEEERRICYVGMTRARENLYMSYAKSRRVYGQEEHRPVSRFIGEIPEQYITANAAIKRPAFLDRYAEKFSHPSRPSDNEYSSGSAKAYSSSTRNVHSNESANVFPNYEDDQFSEASFESAPRSSGVGLSRGDRVRHPIFGVGSIFQVEGSGESQKVSVLFQDKSLKKFMVKNARLEKV
jgi:DNA helicase-2/ATP-dependent DNA helicase PcrA